MDNWKEINAYLRSETPSVCAQEWAGVVASYIPKKILVLMMTGFRPIACTATKVLLHLRIVDERLN